ncbi:hypothetical protein PUG81_02315 [Erwiniaceae bacterium L1_54_6]|nr:hypothetical protein [Erwiniaceae bacterium L1_54_6]
MPYLLLIILLISGTSWAEEEKHVFYAKSDLCSYDPEQNTCIPNAVVARTKITPSSNPKCGGSNFCGHSNLITNFTDPPQDFNRLNNLDIFNESNGLQLKQNDLFKITSP